MARVSSRAIHLTWFSFCVAAALTQRWWGPAPEWLGLTSYALFVVALIRDFVVFRKQRRQLERRSS